jgi:hypothetical protein
LHHKTLWLFAATGTFSIVASLVIAATVAWSFYSIHTAAKWSMLAHCNKSEVLAPPATARVLKNIGRARGGWDRIQMSALSSIRQIPSRWRQPIKPMASSMAYHARSLKYVNLRATGTPCSFIRTSFGEVMRLIARGLNANC